MEIQIRERERRPADFRQRATMCFLARNKSFIQSSSAPWISRHWAA